MTETFRRDRSVEHGFQEAPHGGEGRAKIMGNVCDELLLIILRARDRIGHITQRCGKIAQFILTFHGNMIVHISERVLLCGGNDAPERPVDIFCKEEQDDQRQDQQYD